MRKLVMDLAARRPLWRPPPPLGDRVRATLGSDWAVIQVQAPAESDGDGGPGTDEAAAAAAGAEIYVGFGLPSRVLEAGRSTLRWVHSAAAGVGASVPLLRGTAIQFTNSAGIHAEPMADWVLGAILHFARGFDVMVRAQAERYWAKDRFTDGTRRYPEVQGLRVGVLGLGGVGMAVARRCLALGMTVAGVRRHAELAAPGLIRVEGPSGVHAVASESDVLVVATPATSETEQLVDAAVLGALPEGAILINASRGQCVDQEALHAALDSGRLCGAALDVFATEPLPPGHPFWVHPQVLVSPHVSAVSERFWEREMALLQTNLERYLSGKDLLNLVDLDAGY